jgi:glycosyltransferase involved in cell wall biosynthesis
MNSSPDNMNAKNLFVVDWKNAPEKGIDALLNNSNTTGYHWSFYNCLAKNYAGDGVVNRYISYLSAVLYIIRNKKKYDNIIIWQPMIGFILCLLPRFYSRPKIIITSILYSPGRVKKGSFRLFLLKQALKKADALLYFSDGMAEDVRTVYPQYAKKVFSTYMPVIDSADEAALNLKLSAPKEKQNAVFSGGLSDRDFETVIRAFTNTDIPVTIVCTKLHVFKNPSLISSNFTIRRSVSEIEYHSLVLASSFVVIALENEYSSCGQLLFAFSMKNGIPIIATDCYGTRDYITNNDNGILVPVKDDRAIFNAYNNLVKDAAFREKLIEHSKKKCAQMTFDNYLQKIDSVIQQPK